MTINTFIARCRVAVVLVLGLVMVTACGLVGGSGLAGSPDPVSAVVAAIQQQHGSVPTVRASFPAGSGTMVLYTFQQQGDCHFGEMLAEQHRGSWRPAGGTGTAGPCPGAPGAVAQAFSEGSSSGATGNVSWSLGSGEIFNPDVVRVDVEWDDGAVMTAVVTNGIYYSFRSGVQARVTAVRAYDSADQPVSGAP